MRGMHEARDDEEIDKLSKMRVAISTLRPPQPGSVAIRR